MAQHSKSQKRESNAFGEEDSAQKGRHECKCISDTSNDEVLGWSCALNKGTAVFIRRKVSFPDELKRQNEDLQDCEYQYSVTRCMAETH